MGSIRTCLLRVGTLYGVNKDLLLQVGTLHGVNKDLSGTSRHVIWCQ